MAQNRAKSAKAWLVKKGIDGNRISTRGYGEYNLKNECADGVKCDENRHQRNRRTEFTVTHFDGATVNSKEYNNFNR